MDAKTDEELGSLKNDDEVMNLMSQCGEASVLQVIFSLNV